MTSLVKTADDPLTDPDDADQAAHQIHATGGLLARAVAKALEPHGLTGAQYGALQAIAGAPKPGVGCKEVGLLRARPSADTTRLLNRLESVGLVSRKRDHRDRRVVHTALTESGRRVLAAATPDVLMAEERALAGLSRSDRRELKRMLAVIECNLQHLWSSR